MKPTLLLGCALLAGSALHAQLRFLPHAGFEQSRSTLNYGNGLSAQDINGFLKAGLQTAYQLKGGHAPFINLTTNPAQGRFSFGNDGSLMRVQQASGLLFRMEAGYQFSSKPIQLGRRSPAQRTLAPAAPSSQGTVERRKTCGGVTYTYRSSCGANKQSAPTPPPLKNDNLNMRLQPSVAFAYLPAATPGVTNKTTGFDYTPGWQTAVVPGLGFEFAKGAQRLFTLGVFYTQPFGVKEQTVTTATENKTVSTNLRPQLSTWGLTLGMPLSLGKSSAVSTAKTKSTMTQPTEKKRGCSRYYRRSVQI